jgi:hypothetical protein
MTEDALGAELRDVTAELTSARTRYAILATQIAGLEARHAALTKALSGTAARYRTDAIVAALRSRGRQMSIGDVVGVLRTDGRAHVTADSVGVDLAYLAEQGRVIRVQRGIYGLPDN